MKILTKKDILMMTITKIQTFSSTRVNFLWCEF